MIHFYHPNKKVTGFAASFWHSNRDDTVFATILKQSGWDEKNENGVFKGSMDDPQKRVNVKLDYVELAGILDCIERNRPFNQPHDTEETIKQVSFTPWIDKSDNSQRGFSFSITVTNKQDRNVKNSFYIGLTFAEARLIREFIIFCLHTHFGLVKKSSVNRPQAAPAPEVAQAAPEPQPEAPSEPSAPASDPLDF
jgi:hypothetical protein